MTRINSFAAALALAPHLAGRAPAARLALYVAMAPSPAALVVKTVRGLLERRSDVDLLAAMSRSHRETMRLARRSPPSLTRINVRPVRNVENDAPDEGRRNIHGRSTECREREPAMLKASNVGTPDRAVRMAIGLILIVAPYAVELSLWTNPVARWASLAVGLVLVATALGSFCPLYRLLGVNTCPAR